MAVPNVDGREFRDDASEIVDVDVVGRADAARPTPFAFAVAFGEDPFGLPAPDERLLSLLLA